MEHKIVDKPDDVWGVWEQYKGIPHGWIQFKGTDICMDLSCKCGYLGHFDGYFAYNIKCPKCGTMYCCNGHIELIEIRSIDEDDDCLVVAT